MTKSERLDNWLKRTWKVSKLSNLYLIHGKLRFVIYKNPSGGFKLKVDDKFGTYIYNTIKEAKIRAFEVMEHYYKKKHEAI